MNNLKRFHEAWGHPGRPPATVTEEDIEELENNLSIELPESYRSQVLKVGLPSPTADLWDWLSVSEERQIKWTDRLPLLALILPESVPHLADFHHPSDAQKALAWREAGMPECLLPFANDSSGNQICFNVEALRGGSPRESPVVFWDHDFLTTTKLAKSFDAFLKRYLP